MNKKLAAKIQKLIPALGENEAVISSSIAIEPPEKDLVLKKGNVYTVFDIVSSTPVSVGLITNVINDVLYDSYYHSDNVSPIQSLEKAIVNINEKVSSLATQNNVDATPQTQMQPAATKVDFNILAAVLWGNVLYIVQYGKGKSFLMREGEIKEVSATSEGNFSVASGVVRSDDVIVISTEKFSDKFPPEKLLGSAISSNDLEPSQSSMILKFSIDAEFTADEMIDFNLPKEKNTSKFSQVMDNIKSKRSKKEPKVQPITSLTDDLPEIKSSQEAMPEPGPAEIPAAQEPVATPPPAPLPPLEPRSNEPNVQLKPASGAKFNFGPKSALIIVAVLLVISVFATVLIRNNKPAEDSQNSGQETESSLTVPEELNKEEVEEVAPTEEELAQKDLEQKMQEDKQKGIARIDAQPFYDIKLADENADPTNIAVFNNTVVVTDTASGKIFSSNAATPKFTALEDTFPGISNAVNYNGDLYFSDDAGFKVYNLVDSAVENSYEGSFGITNVYLGNIYSVEANTMKKYVTSEDALEESTWGEDESFGKTASMAIAYSIYTVTEDGQLNVYTQGNKADFEITGLDTPLSKPTQIIANADYDYLYVADSGNGRVVVIDSDGNFVRQIKPEKEADWEDIRSIGVNPNETKLFVLSGSRVFDVDLEEALAVEEEVTTPTEEDTPEEDTEETQDTTETTE